MKRRADRNTEANAEVLRARRLLLAANAGDEAARREVLALLDGSAQLEGVRIALEPGEPEDAGET